MQRAVIAHLSGERIDYGVHRSSCAFDSAVRDILGRVRSAPRHVRCRSDRPRLDSANRHGHPENDRKERFHGTRVFVPDGSRAFTRSSSRLRSESPIPAQQTQSAFHRRAQRNAFIRHNARQRLCTLAFE